MSDQIEKKLFGELKGSERAMFDALLKSYYLDDDQLDYLHRYYKPIFTIGDEENCICLSNKKYFECCKSKVLATNAQRDNYVSILEVISKPELKEKYLNQEKGYFKAAVLQQNQATCIIKDCQNPAIKIALYHQLPTKPQLFLDHYNEKHYFKNINTNFLDLVNPDETPYTFNVICHEHHDKLLINNKLADQIKALLINYYDNLIDHHVAYQTFLQYYQLLSVAEQVIMTLKLKKIIKLHYFYDLELMRITSDLNNDKNSYIIKEIPLTKKISVLQCNDILLAQLTPITFQAINSPNNPFLPNKILYANIVHSEKHSSIQFVYHKNNRIYNTYFEEWTEKIKTSKQWENFISSLIINLSNHLLLDQKYYEKLNEKQKQMLNIYYYNRFEQPRNSGQEMMLQTFINNFHNGINIIK
ncbi:hypothetical protein [Spiroplasma chrysopicola]|uniref:Uncharacterized protein n=1 Tax=Spiroplasma chrysopicola DF-1 TaxID=1276227 RepID=R4UFV4_9MOLU|nr:hypothetical protein [Spiroplasma chrysopicola]AGM25040.1 hypothetical protein SCHRY_v1c04590 [Spiroplasma chrysopicola DF-1]